MRTKEEYYELVLKNRELAAILQSYNAHARILFVTGMEMQRMCGITSLS